MLRTISAYVGTGAVMLVLDIIWLSTMIGIYRQYIGEVLLDGVRMGPAIAFYLLYVAGITYFAVLPSLDGGSWTDAAIRGAALGLIGYGTYDLTNQATLKVWPTAMTVLDMSWGTFLTSLSAIGGFLAASYMTRA